MKLQYVKLNIFQNVGEINITNDIVHENFYMEI